MTPDVIEGANVPFHKPANWNEERDGPCQTLHVRVDHEQGGKFMTSAWRPEADEVGWMLAGANIHLGLSAPSHPVVRLTVATPPLEADPVYTIVPARELNGSPSVLVTMYAPRSGITRRGGSVWCQIEVKRGDLVAAVAQGMAQIEAKAKELGIK